MWAWNKRKEVAMIRPDNTKNLGSFPNDESLIQLFYLALHRISEKWSMPLRDWKFALNRVPIQFD